MPDPAPPRAERSEAGPKSEFRCPACGQAFLAAESAPRADRSEFPFCSARCRAVDLAKWVDEEYRISEPLLPLDPAAGWGGQEREDGGARGGGA